MYCLFQGIDIVKSEPIRKFYSGFAKVDSSFQGKGSKPTISVPHSPVSSRPSVPAAALLPSSQSKIR